MVLSEFLVLEDGSALEEREVGTPNMSLLGRLWLLGQKLGANGAAEVNLGLSSAGVLGTGVG